MLPSILLTTPVTFTPRTATKNQYNRETFTTISSAAISANCYVTRVSVSPFLVGKEMNIYTHLLYMNYNSAIGSADYIVTIDSEVYEIVDIMDTVNNHHTELGIRILRDK